MSPTVHDIVANFLVATDYDGLYNEDHECACILQDELAPCGDGPYPDCVAGFVEVCPEGGFDYIVTADGAKLRRPATRDGFRLWVVTDDDSFVVVTGNRGTADDAVAVARLVEDVSLDAYVRELDKSIARRVRVLDEDTGDIKYLLDLAKEVVRTLGGMNDEPTIIVEAQVICSTRVFYAT